MIWRGLGPGTYKGQRIVAAIQRAPGLYDLQDSTRKDGESSTTAKIF